MSVAGEGEKRNPCLLSLCSACPLWRGSAMPDRRREPMAPSFGRCMTGCGSSHGHRHPIPHLTLATTGIRPCTISTARSSAARCWPFAAQTAPANRPCSRYRRNLAPLAGAISCPASTRAILPICRKRPTSTEAFQSMCSMPLPWGYGSVADVRVSLAAKNAKIREAIARLGSRVRGSRDRTLSGGQLSGCSSPGFYCKTRTHFAGRTFTAIDSKNRRRSAWPRRPLARGKSAPCLWCRMTHLVRDYFPQTLLLARQRSPREKPMPSSPGKSFEGPLYDRGVRPRRTFFARAA